MGTAHDHPAARTITVALAERSYDVHVGPGLLRRLGELTRAALGDRPARCLLAHDDGLPAATVESARVSLASAGFSVTPVPVHASEVDKSIAAAERLCIAMAQARLERHEPVVALGGGVVGDLAGFAAAIYRRGVPVIQCPTTLLSMVDASVGGKTGANLTVPETDGVALLKNLVGVFHQPSLVLADVDVLASLPPRHLRAGLAECVKHALLARDVETPGEHPSDLLADTAQAGQYLSCNKYSDLTSLIARNIAIKARVVAGDERELSTDPGGGRAALNLGHTFGHAIETLATLTPDGDPRHAPLLHGEAVALGLHAAAATALTLNMLNPDDLGRVVATLDAVGLPTRVSNLPSDDALIERMAHDKKVAGGRLRLILPAGLGHVRVLTDPPIQAVRAGWAAIRA